MNRRLSLVLSLTTAIVIAVIALLFFRNQTLPTVQINYNSSPRASVELVKRATSQVTVIESGATYKVENGTYDIKVSGDGVEPVTQQLTIKDESQTVTVAVSLTNSRLEALRSTEEPAITEMLSMTYPGFERLYVLQPGSSLYLDGTWFAGRLRYIGMDNSVRDTLKVVMHKEKGSWVVITKPPQIIVSAATYPSIPTSVVSDINKEEVVDVSQ